MNKSILLLLLFSAFNLNTITKGSKISNGPVVDEIDFKIYCVREQLIKLLKVADDYEEIDKYLKAKKLDKYFGDLERAEVKRICKQIGIKDVWLYAVIWFESRGNPKAKNKLSKATGIIQFMPKTAIGLGTTINELYDMTVIEQLHYVEKYLTKWDNRYDLTTYADTYLAVFYPAALGKGKSYVIGSEYTMNAAKIAEQNPSIDMDKNGTITVADFIHYAGNI